MVNFLQNTVESIQYEGPDSPGAGSFTLPGGLHYNGIDFPFGTKIRIQANPVYTTSGLQIKYTRYTVEVDTVFFAGRNDGNTYITTDTDMEDLRQRLTQSGARLKVKNIGFGTDLNIIGVSNSTLDRRDVVYGPHPQVITWRPLGGGKSCAVTWRCDFSVPYCQTPPRSILEFEWSCDWSIREGLTTRTVSGQLELASYVALEGGLTTIQRTADDIREHITSTIPPIPRFRRDLNFSLSDDKRILRFNLTDSEIESREAFSPGMINEDVTYSFQNRQPYDFKSWTHTLSGTVTVSPSHPKDWAWFAISKYFLQRQEMLQEFRSKVRQQLSGDVSYYRDLRDSSGNLELPEMIPMTLRFSEELNGRSISFEFSWWYAVNLKHIIEASGLFLVSKRKENRKRWEAWQKSMEDPRYSMKNRGAPFSARGSAQLQDDTPLTVINICTPYDYPSPGQVSPGDEPDSRRANPQQNDYKPDPYNGMLEYKPQLDLYENGNIISRRTLTDPTDGDTNGQTGDESSNSWERATTPTNPTQTYRRGTILVPSGETYKKDHNPITSQKRGPRTYTLRTSGYGIRVGMGCPIPRIEWAGSLSDTSKAPIQHDKKVRSRIIARNSPYQIYLTMWDVSYTLDKLPAGDILDPANILVIGQGFREGVA